MFLFSYLAFLCFLIGLVMTVLSVWLGPRSPFHWAVAVTTAGYALYSFSYVWVFGAHDPSIVWFFFHLSVWGFGLLIPSGALAAELLLARVRPSRALAIWLPLTAYWIFSLVWATLDRAIVTGFRPTPWGNAAVAAPSTLLAVGAAVVLIQKVAVWVILWRARSKPELQPLRGLLTFFVPADAAALVLVTAAQLAASATPLPSTAGLLGLANVGLLFVVVVGWRRVLGALKTSPQPVPATKEAALERFGITAGERSVLDLLLQGHDRKTIAQRRFIAEGTVKAHIHSIYAKTGAKNRVELMLRLSADS